MKLRHQIILLAALPLVALLIIGAYLSIVKLQEMRSASATQDRLRDALFLTELVHVLQVERGQSAGFVASQGSNFQNTLPQVRDASDAVIARKAPHLADLRPQLEKIEQVRGQIDRLNVSVPELAGVYTGVINELMALSKENLNDQRQANMMRLGGGVIALGDAKEAAGLQRAAGAAGFGAGQFSPAVFQSFLEKGAVETAHLGFATVELAELLTEADIERALSVSGIDEMRQAVEAAGPGTEITGYSAPEWFARATDWIDELRAAEISVFSEMSIMARSNLNWATALFAGACFLTLASLVATAWVAMRLIKSFDAGFAALDRSLLRLGNGEYDGRTYEKEGKTEIDKLFAAIDQTRAKLFKADQEITENEKARTFVICELDAALQQLSQGNLTAQVEESFPKEFESLRISFNTALHQLCSAIEDVRDAANIMHHSSAALSNSNDELSKRTALQTVVCERTSTALTRLTEMAAGSANSTSEAYEAASRLRIDAQEGAEQIAKAVHAIQEIENSTNEMTGMVGLIEDISFQTNLLALNAGVEAARAGAAGKGFAVVANEVRMLAARATETTVAIKKLIENAAAKTSNGVVLVESTGAVFASINEGVRRAGNSVDNIASEANAQAKSIDEIKSSMVELDRATQENADMVEDSISLGANLKKEANGLQGIVSKFQTSGASNELRDAA